jgi:hypothetical protein
MSRRSDMVGKCLGVKGSQVQILSSRRWLGAVSAHGGRRPYAYYQQERSAARSMVVLWRVAGMIYTASAWGPLGDRGARRYAVSASPASAKVWRSGCR